MNKFKEKEAKETEQSHPEANETNQTDRYDQTNFQVDAEKTSDNAPEGDKLSDDPAVNKNEPAWEEKYAELNDTHLRLIAEFDNFRKRTLREKADLIKAGGASVLTNILPVIDDFERALNTLQTSEDMTSIVDGVRLIYDKFIGYLSQQGVKMIDAAGQPFNTDLFEAVAMFPVAEEDRKGKVIDCLQTGYMLYDKVLRHAKVVVGE